MQSQQKESNQHGEQTSPQQKSKISTNELSSNHSSSNQPSTSQQSPNPPTSLHQRTSSNQQQISVENSSTKKNKQHPNYNESSEINHKLSSKSVIQVSPTPQERRSNHKHNVEPMDSEVSENRNDSEMSSSGDDIVID